MTNIAIHWFRKCVRLHDNKALVDAISSCSNLIPLYILDTEHLNPDKTGVNRMGFILDSLKSLDEDLREKGSKLYVARGNVVDVLLEYTKKYGAKKITFERDTEPYNKKNDERIMKISETHNIEVDVKAFWGHTLFDPEYLLYLNNGKAPLTMSSFLALISKAKGPSKPINAPDEIPPIPITDVPELTCQFNAIPTLSDLKDYGYDSKDKSTWFVGGEREAIKTMEDFLAQKKRVAKFEKPKTEPTSLTPDTTALSPYITLGSLSIRLFYSKLKETLKSMSTSKPPVSLEGQIYWREMAYLIGFSTPNFDRMVGNPVCKQIPWLDGEDTEVMLKKWEMGQTGYPAVDAAMNQLRTEGWMHHLARHLVACFLTRGDLWITWELGRDVFEKYLVDADWSINNFSWHWLSCSAFFTQYWRCYGPVTFFKKTDPSGAYIKKHVPILKKFPEKYIYEPWLAPKSMQEAAGCIIGKDYPSRMVDHAVVSKKNMARMKEVYSKGKADEPQTKKKKTK